MKSSSRAQDIALTIGAVLGLLCIVTALAAVFFGITPLVFRSGSMSPAITTGSLALGYERPATEVETGDVVSVDRSDGSRITHRVASVGASAGNSATLTLKGDANEAADPEPYVVTSVTEVVASVPYAGYFVAWLSTPFAWAAGAFVSGALVWIAFRRTPTGTPTRTGRHRTSGRHARPRVTAAASVALTVAVAGVVGVGFSRAETTAAAVSDTGTASATVTAATLTRPTSFTCTTTGTLLTTATLTWVASNSLYSHRLIYTPTSGAAVVQNVPAGTSSATPPAAILNLLTTWTVTLYSTYEQFVSVQSLGRVINATSLIGIGVLSSCVSAGTTTAAATPRSARAAEPQSAPITSTAPSVTATPTSPLPSSTAAPTPTTTSSSTPSITPGPSTATTTLPTTTLAPTTTTTTPTTPPPPPASAFIADGSSRTRGDAMASVTGSQLTITDASGTTVFQRSVSRTDRYGTGVTWSDDGNLYILSEGSPVRVVAGADGLFTASTVTAASLPSDIAALV